MTTLSIRSDPTLSADRLFLEKLATKEKDKIEKSIRQVLRWNFRRIVMAHGSVIENKAKEKLTEGYEWFLDKTLCTEFVL